MCIWWTHLTCPGEVLYQASDEATAQGLLRRKIPAAIGTAGDLFRIDVRALDQFGKPGLVVTSVPKVTI